VKVSRRSEATKALWRIHRGTPDHARVAQEFHVRKERLHRWPFYPFHLDVFDLQLAWGKLDIRVASQQLSSCSGQREWLHPIRGGFGEKDKKAICAVFLSSHGIPGQLWHGPVSPCGFSRGL